jgi:hypothetical protein
MPVRAEVVTEVNVTVAPEAAAAVELHSTAVEAATTVAATTVASGISRNRGQHRNAERQSTGKRKQGGLLEHETLLWGLWS